MRSSFANCGTNRNALVLFFVWILCKIFLFQGYNCCYTNKRQKVKIFKVTRKERYCFCSKSKEKNVFVQKNKRKMRLNWCKKLDKTDLQGFHFIRVLFLAHTHPLSLSISISHSHTHKHKQYKYKGFKIYITMLNRKIFKSCTCNYLQWDFQFQNIF